MATIEGLQAFTNRGAGSDAERRAANWLVKACAAAGLDARIETFWCRPNWALAQLWHVAIAVAGSLIALAVPVAGIALLAIALASVIADALTGASLGRRLTPERASQNVIATAPRDPGEPTRALILTANYDAARIGLAYRLRPLTGRLRQATQAFTPGWLGWLALAIAWLLGVAILRETGHTSKIVGAIQLPPTVGLLIGFALLLELATGHWSPSAGDNGSGTAVALNLAAALAEAPPQHLSLELLLSGSGDAEQLGLRRYLRAQARSRPQGRRRFWPTARSRSDAIVVGLAACGGGRPRWWQSDGAFLPLRYAAPLRRLAQRLADEESHLEARPHRGRGTGPALPARASGLAAITLGCLDETGVPPRSHGKTDVAAAVDPQAVERAVQFTLLLVDGIDSAVGEDQRRRTATPA